MTSRKSSELETEATQKAFLKMFCKQILEKYVHGIDFLKIGMISS